jgi:hypothetical protein
MSIQTGTEKRARSLMMALASSVALSCFWVSSTAAHPGHSAQVMQKGASGVSSPAVTGRFKTDAIAGPVSAISHTEFRNDPEAFQFVIVSDNTGGARTGVFESAVGKINLLQPEFVVSVGDLIEGYSESPEILASQWAYFESMVNRIEAPFFYAPGNHDYSNNVMADLWKKKFGRSFYHFTYKDALFVVLNTEHKHPGGAQPKIDEEQRAYLAKVLADNPKPRWTFLFMHQPVWSIGKDTGWTEVEALLKGRPYTGIAGHMHTYEHVEQAGRDLITLGTTGGGSQLRGEAYGEFDHVTWVTMGKDGPIIANLALDGITDKYVTAPGFAQRFQKLPTFALEPWFVSEGGGVGSNLRLKVHNPFDAPLSFSIEAPQHPSILLTGDPLSGTVPAASDQVFEIPVTVSKTSGASRPLELRAAAKVTLGGREVDWNNVMRAAPVARNTLTKATMPIVHDGSIEEWGNLRFAGETPARAPDGKAFDVTRADASFRFDVAYDDNFLHVAIDVKDDEVTPGLLSGKHDAQDLAILTLDGRPVAQSATNVALTTTMKSGDWIFIMGTPNATEGERLFGAIMPPIFAVKMKRKIGGYTAEFRVPLAYIASKHPSGNWTDLRLNIAINDIDPQSKPSRPPLAIGWQSDWREQLVGTGTFFKK